MQYMIVPNGIFAVKLIGSRIWLSNIFELISESKGGIEVWGRKHEN